MSNKSAFYNSQLTTWFNDTAPSGNRSLQALLRAGIAHLYFVSIHPFEDGNGRIGRALAEKAMAQCLGQPTLIAIAATIERNKKPITRPLSTRTGATKSPAC